jgi:hypothetical protein
MFFLQSQMIFIFFFSIRNYEQNQSVNAGYRRISDSLGERCIRKFRKLEETLAIEVLDT